MAKLTFFRQRRIEFGSPSSFQTQVLKLEAGFSAPISSESGMSVNLKLIDQWLGRLYPSTPVSLSSSLFEELQRGARELSSWAQGEGATLQELSLGSESDQLSWVGGSWRTRHRVPVFHQQDSWRRQAWQELTLNWTSLEALQTQFSPPDFAMSLRLKEGSLSLPFQGLPGAILVQIKEGFADSIEAQKVTFN